MKTLRLEVGKTYRSREGKEVRIVRSDNTGRYPYQGSDDEWYTENGRFDLDVEESSYNLIAEVPETRHTFNIPDDWKEVTSTRYTFGIPEGTKGITVEQVSNRIVVEMVPTSAPKPGDVMVNDVGSVYIFKSAWGNGESHKPFAYLGDTGKLFFAGWCSPGRPATPEEAQPLWDALKKAGKKWNAETMQVEEIAEIDRILEWVETNIKDGYYNQEGVAEAIEEYLKQKEDEK